jgi:hypothetical protein
MNIHNLQNNSAVVFSGQTERVTTSGTSGQNFEPLFRINLIRIQTKSNKILFTKEDSGVTQEEEKNYYKKTLKSKLA